MNKPGWRRVRGCRTRCYTDSVTKLAAIVLAIALASPAAASTDSAMAALSLIRPNRAQPAKDFRVSTPDSRPLSLSDFKGKVVFLNFWATWCKPCEAEMPGMERLYQKYKGQGLVV